MGYSPLRVTVYHMVVEGSLRIGEELIFLNWLGHWSQIPLHERQILPELLQEISLYILSQQRERLGELVSLIWTVESCLTKQEQKELLSRLMDSHISSIATETTKELYL